MRRRDSEAIARTQQRHSPLDATANAHHMRLIEAAEDIADQVLFPAALQTDAAPLVPRANLEALAKAGLFGIAGPAEYGGADAQTLWSVVEALAGGCLATTFVWNQHHNSVRGLMVSPNQELRRRWLEPLCRGESWAGVAFGGLRAGPAQVSVRPASGGWTLHGLLPQITGWRLIDVVMISARTEDDRRVVSMLLPAEPAPGMVPEPLTLIAANASSTVRLRLDGVFVPSSNVMSNWPYVPPPEYDGGGRPNGSLSLGVARRCLRLMGAGPLDSELEARRRQLDEAKDRDLAGARAAAAGLALRAAAALIVSQGSTSILAGQHAQRLYREAAFLLVFGSRPATRTALLRRLGAAVDAS